LSSFVEKIIARFDKVTLTSDNLHKYQSDAAEFMYRNPFSALFIDTGLGKTGTSLNLIMRLIGSFEANRVLIIAPLRVANVTWPDEILNWSFSAPLTHAIIRDDELVDYVNKAGQAARRRAKLDGHESKDVQDAMVKEARLKASQRAVRQLLVRNPATIHIVSKDMIEFLVEAWGRDWPYDCVIIDESSALKDHTTNRWKALWKVRPLIKRMHQLTATPASESYIHLFAQITLLDKGERLGKSFTKFTQKWFTQNKYTRRWEMREGAEKEITDKISDICLVMLQKDYLELEDPQFVYHKVKLDAKQRELYDTMENEFVVELDDGEEVEAETAAALYQKLLQMASGVLYQTVLDEQPDGEFKSRRVVHKLHDHKLDALRQLIDDLDGEPVIIVYHHQSSMDRILKAFPKAQAMDKGGKLIAAWNKRKIPILLLHPQSGAHGLNLQKGGRHMIWFDIAPSYENYYQMYRRLARQGQTGIVIIHHLVADGTLDEQVIYCLANKRDAQDMLFKLLKAKRAKLKRMTVTFDNEL
jgi:hypothetical protein